MRVHRALVALVILTPAGLLAQQATASIAAGASSVRFAEQAAFASVTLTPSVHVSSRLFSAGGSATLSSVEGAGWSQQGLLSLAGYTPPSAGGLVLELGGVGGGSAHPDGASTAQALGATRVHLLREWGGAWLGGGLGAMYDGAVWRGVRQAEAGLSWRRALETFTVFATPTVTDDTLGYTDLLAAFTISRGRVDLSGSLGGRIGSTLPIVGGEQRVWGGVGLVAWVAERAALTAAVGTYPVDLTQGYPAGQFVSAGIRFGALRPAHIRLGQETRRLRLAARDKGIHDFAVRAIDDTRVNLRVRAPNATRVEVNADLTGWSPVALTQGRDGWWEGVFDARAHTVELVVRIDGGAWQVPPGADPSTDEFGFVSGRVVVRGRM
ncbi:MAG: hypothetical protein WD771_11465 [Gemmatimonadaceae bacterium]